MCIQDFNRAIDKIHTQENTQLFKTNLLVWSTSRNCLVFV